MIYTILFNDGIYFYNKYTSIRIVAKKIESPSDEQRTTSRKTSIDEAEAE